jgi:response regulator NasT
MKVNVVMSVSNEKHRKALTDLLKREGLLVQNFSEANSLLRFLRRQHIELIILDEEIKNLSLIDVVNIIHSEQIAPVLILEQGDKVDYLSWIKKGWIYSYFRFPVSYTEIRKMVTGACVHGKRIIEVEQKYLSIKQTLSNRVIIERAKGIIMDKRNCPEEEAYEYLRSLSMNRGLAIEEIAKVLINTMTEKEK